MKLEILRQDGQAKLSKLDLLERSLITPSIATNLVSPLKHTPSKQRPLLNPNIDNDYLNILILPSWQFLEIDPEADPSIVLQELQTLVENSGNSYTFVQLPQDAALSASHDKTPYFHLYSTVYEELSKKMPIAFGMPFETELKTLCTMKKKEPTLISVYNISSFLTRPKKLLKGLVNVRSNLSSGDLISAPAVPPSYFPLLCYLGVDVYDASFAVMASKKGYFLDDNALFSAKNFNSGNCLCQFCRNLNSSDSAKTALGHNLLVTEEQMVKCQRAIHNGNLWDLIRRNAVDNPTILTTMRLLKDYYDFLERNCPISRSGYLAITIAEDLWRPEVERFRQRIRERYTPPSQATLCLILPCSARKPYSSSQSHQRFSKVIKNFRRKATIVELVLTSPLGIVPCTLENIYPAASYDIPVTGDWTRAEHEMVLHAFQDVLNKMPANIPVLVHLNPIERSLLQNGLQQMKRPVYFCEFSGAPSSNEALRNLDFMLNKLLKDNPRPLRLLNEKEQILKDTLDYQFGKNTSKMILDGSETIKGKPHIRMQVYKDNSVILTYLASTGMVTLSWRAAELLMKEMVNIVHFNGDKLKGSTLFCSAIEKADEKIRPGDEVMILGRNEQLLGIGRSLLSSNALVHLQRGPGVKIRHKRNPTEQ
ncbi:MAG: DUF5591 domain-containing protein [Candidatus Heimdallarchaeota archaeon]